MSFSYDNSTKILTQTGRDADLSGIAGSAWGSGTTYAQGTLVNYNEKVYQATVLIGSGNAAPDSNSDWLDTGIKYIVQKQLSQQGLYTYDVPSDIRMNIRGTLFHDPEEEILILRHDYSGSGEVLSLNIDDGNTDGSMVWRSNYSRDSQNRIVITNWSGHGFEAGDGIKINNMTRGDGSYDEITVNGEGPSNNNQGWYAGKTLPVAEVTSDSITIATTEYSEGVPTRGRFVRKPAYNYGKLITEPTGRTRTSRGCGLFINGNHSGNNYHANGAAFGSGPYGGVMTCRGGTICITKPIDVGQLGFDWIDTTIFSVSGMESRGMGGAGRLRNVKLINYNFQGINATQVWEKGLVLEDGHLMEIYSEGFSEIELLNFDVTGNVNGTDIGHAKSSQFYHRDWVAINSASGSNVKGMWRDTTSQPSQMGNVFVAKEVSFNFKDTSDQAVGGVKVYAEDNPSPYAKKVTYPVPTHASYNYTATTYTAQQKGNTLGVLNSDGTVTYDYTNPITYLKTADANGDVEKFRVTTGAQMLEYSTDDSNAIFPNTTLPEGVTENRYHGEFGYTIPGMSNNRWSDDGNGNTASGWAGQPEYYHWDTDLFGGFYKVDRRGNDNTDADEFTFYFGSYRHALASSTQALKGVGELAVKWVLFNDSSITETNQLNVDGYQEITSPERFYDRAKSYLVSNYAGEANTIVSRSGNTINIGSYDLDVDAGENAPVFAFDGSKITIKAGTFVGNITTTGGTITLLNNAEIVGSYGDISVLPFTITNVEAGSTVQLYNVTDQNEISNAVVTGTAGTKVTYSGTYANSLADPDDEVRLRITCQSGTTALLPFETFGVASTAGISFKANQVDDTIYNNNAIDGSASNYDSATLEIDADFTNFELDVSDTDNPGSVTVQQIYAKYAYLVTTSEGIQKFFGAITAENGSNYRINTSIVDLKIQNVSTSDMIITGARLYRDDNTTVIIKGASGSGTLSHDTGEFLQYIQPQVTAALNEYGVAGPDDLNPIKKNTNLIPGLL